MALGKLAVAEFLDAVPEEDDAILLIDLIDGALILTEQMAPRAV